jgi:hypothetical protein
VTRLLAARAGPVLLLWLLGGRVGLLVGVAVAVCDQLWAPSPTQLLRAALLGFCLLPLAVLARGLPTPSTVTPLFAGGNLLAHHLAGTALALLVLGILRDVRPAPVGPGNGPPGDDLRRPLPPARELPAGGAGLAGNGARQPLPAPVPALPAPAGATHPPLWDPARRPPPPGHEPAERAPPTDGQGP